MTESEGQTDVITHKNSINSLNKQNSENDENTLSKKFKALMRETSVYKYFIELKEDALTEQGYFDLVRMPCTVYLEQAGQILREIRWKNHIKQRDIAKMVGVAINTEKQWEYNSNRIPLHSLIIIAKNVGISRDEIYSQIYHTKISLKRFNIPMRLKQISDIMRYLVPTYKNQVHVLKCNSRILSKIQNSLNLIPKRKKNSAVLHSKELYYFLSTFFKYSTVPKIIPPLTDEVKGWHDEGTDLTRAIIIPCLQSDGCIDKHKKALVFIGHNRCLHDYFVDAMYYEYGELPSSYYIPGKGEVPVTVYGRNSIKPIVNKIKCLAGNTKTKPANGQTIEEYLQESQPQLNYLINASLNEQQIALRFWAATEGRIGIHKNRSARIMPALGIASAHPALLAQLRQLAERHGIHFTITYDRKKWSGISGLVNASFKGSINFLKFGGFIKGVKVSARSPYHEGIDKQILMLGILEYLRRRRIKKCMKKLPMPVHHQNINQIISKKKYKSTDFYIDCYS